jgi:hypothetical protein
MKNESKKIWSSRIGYRGEVVKDGAKGYRAGLLSLEFGG